MPSRVTPQVRNSYTNRMSKISIQSQQGFRENSFKQKGQND